MICEREVCEICLQPITNPICLSCYLKHVGYWLNDFKLSGSQAREVIRKIKEKLPEETLNEYRCVLCGRENIGVCMYCAFLKTSGVILKLDAPKRTVKAFLESSNFDREHEAE